MGMCNIATYILMSTIMYIDAFSPKGIVIRANQLEQIKSISKSITEHRANHLISLALYYIYVPEVIVPLYEDEHGGDESKCVLCCKRDREIGDRGIG